MHSSTENKTKTNNKNETINHDAIAILSCAIPHKRIEQLVKMFVLTVVLWTSIGNSALPM
jgi:hypothetical protein